MQILFVHSNFPAQFGPILSRLAGREDVECVFVTMAATGTPHAGVYEACKVTPDLGTTVFLRELYEWARSSISSSTTIALVVATWTIATTFLLSK